MNTPEPNRAIPSGESLKNTTDGSGLKLPPELMAIALAILGVVYGGTSTANAQNIASLVQQQPPAAAPSPVPPEPEKPAQPPAASQQNMPAKSYKIDGLVALDLRAGQPNAPLAGGPVIDLRTKITRNIGVFGTVFASSTNLFDSTLGSLGGYAGPTFDFRVPGTPIHGTLSTGAGAQVLNGEVRPMSGNLLSVSSKIPKTGIELSSFNIAEFTFPEHGKTDRFYRSFYNVTLTQYLEHSRILRLLGLQGGGAEMVSGQSPYMSVFGALPGKVGYRIGYAPKTEPNQPRWRFQLKKDFSFSVGK